MPAELDDASWIARPAPRSTRIVRQISRDRTDWIRPGHSLGQQFRAEGPVVALNVDLLPPPDAADPHGVDVSFTVALETTRGAVIASRTFEGPQLVWDYFGPLLDVDPPAPPGEYVAVVRSQRETIGWSTADRSDDGPDDGVSPLPVTSPAVADGSPVPGVRMLGVETLPAPNPVFRRAFRLDEGPDHAELAASVLGTGVIRVNGVRVGDEMLEPAVTDYDKSVLYRTWDVTHLLHAGDNELLIEAGRERYSARGGDVWGWNLAPWHREPVAVLGLTVTAPDGTVTRVVSDATWQTTTGPVRAERLFRGEDWVLGADDEQAWEPAVVVTPPAGRLRPATVPPVLALAPRPPRSVQDLDESRTVYDFGEVMVGRIRCRVSGGPGASVRVVSGEQRAGDGAVICDNFLVAGEAQLDTLRLESSREGYEWEPQFGYRGFRWMQVETSGGAVVDEVRAVPLYTPLEEVGGLTTDEPLVEWIDTATARTFRNNFHGIPTDTPIYEKNGWTADAHLATEALLHHLDLRDAFGKWLDDHVDAQAPDGSVPQIIPTPGWGRASDPTWSSSAVLIPWYLYREYGDLSILTRYEDLVRRFADNLIVQLDGGPWRGRTWGDWLSPGHMVGPEGMAPIGTITAVAALQHTAAVLRELGADDADQYASAAAQTGAVYHESWFDAAAGAYAVPGVGYRQALNILPLAYGVVPDAYVPTVRAGLVDDLEHRTRGHLDCGAVGVRHLLPVLSDAGRDDLAITVLTRRSLPGWGAWFTAGEQTLLESWDTDARSRNHYFLGSVSAWIQQRVGALRVVEPGWRAFEIAPVDDPRVTRARAWHRTPLGEARVAWARGPGGWRVEATVPAGATARVRVPGATRDLDPGDHVLHLPVATTEADE